MVRTGRRSTLYDLTGLVKWLVIATVVGIIAYFVVAAQMQPTAAREQSLQSLLWWQGVWKMVTAFGWMVLVSLGLMMLSLSVIVIGYAASKIVEVRNKAQRREEYIEKTSIPAPTTSSPHLSGEAVLNLLNNYNYAVRGKGKDPVIRQAQIEARKLEIERKRLAIETAEIRKAKLLEKPKEVVEEDVPEIWQDTDPLPAFQKSTGDTFYFAQVASGELISWNHRKDGAHIRIHGETGSGKTMLALSLIGQMIFNDWSVIIMDRRRFKNYKVFEGKAQFVDTTNIAMMSTSIEQIADIHAERDRSLGDHGVDDIDGLARKPERICVVIDEFLAHMNYAKKEGLYEDILNSLESLTAESRATGIHFLFIDQKPVAGTWGAIMRANVTSAFSGYMPKGQGRTTTGSDMGAQLEGFRFWDERKQRFIRGWDVKDILNRNRNVMPTLPDDVINVQSAQRIIKAKEEVDTADELKPKQREAINAVLAMPEASISKQSKEFNVSETYIKFARKYIRENGLLD